MFNSTVLTLVASLTLVANDEGIQLDKITLPDGFSITVYTDDVPSARAMSLGDRGTVFVGSRRGGKVYAVSDTDGDQRADQVRVVAQDLKMPTGVTYNDGDLFIGDVGTIYRLDDIEAQLENPPSPTVVTDAFPTEQHHGWKFIDFGPDGKLYVPIGAPCNICNEPGFAQIRRMNRDGTNIETFAEGIRNTVGFTWHPDTEELWFTDNGRDWMGDDQPPGELNRAPKKGLHFGYPYCHGNDVIDPEFGKNKSCNNYEAPAQQLGAHVAPLGLAFYTGQTFPESYRNAVIIAEHGSWNRSKKVGYRLTRVTVEDGRGVRYEPFAEGWLQGQKNWGRPADVMVMPDGALLVSDDQTGAIYRIQYGSAALSPSAP